MFALAVFAVVGSLALLSEGKVCNIFGDPHVVTFDGLKYKFAGACNYVLAMDCVNMEWIIYGHFTSCGKGSCLETISIFHEKKGGLDALLVGRGWVINHQGAKLAYSQGQDFQIGNIGVSFDGLYLTISLAGTGISIVYDGAMAVQISLDTAVNPDAVTCGLCGNNDGVPDNEASQLRSIGNDLESSGLYGLDGFVFQWKVDRGDYCYKPAIVESDRRLPCGNDYTLHRKNDRARAVCQQLVDNQELFKCHETVNLNMYYEACLTDYCSVTLLTEGYPVHCSTASAYAKHCQMMGVGVSDEVWRREMTCPSVQETQQAILNFGPQQPNSPVIF